MLLTHFRFKTNIISSLICFSLLGLTSLAIADQNDPRLDELFEQLHTTDNQQAGDDVTDKIWEIWRESGDAEIDKLMKNGIAAMERGHLRQAVFIFDRIIETAPEFAEGWNKRATVYFFLKEYHKSAADVRTTLLLEPRHFGATAGLGLIFLSLQHYQSALEAFRRALDINPHLVGPKQQIRLIQRLLSEEQV